MVQLATSNLGEKPKQVLADSGYFSNRQVTDESLAGIDLLVLPDRACTTCETTDGKPADEDNPPRCGGFVKYVAPVTAANRMRAKLTAPEGRGAYAKRAQTVEPVFGQVKQAGGFRRFLMRGRTNVAHEWVLICLASNLKKLFRAQRAPQVKVADTDPSRRTCVQAGRQTAMNAA